MFTPPASTIHIQQKKGYKKDKLPRVGDALQQSHTQEGTAGT